MDEKIIISGGELSLKTNQVISFIENIGNFGIGKILEVSLYITWSGISSLMIITS